MRRSAAFVELRAAVASLWGAIAVCPPAVRAFAARAALVFYDSCFSFVFMIIYWLSVPAEREGSFAYMGAKPAMGWSIILIGSFAAFMYNMSIFYFTKLASAVAVMVSTNLLKARHGPSPLQPHSNRPLQPHFCAHRQPAAYPSSLAPAAGRADHSSGRLGGHPRPDQLDRDHGLLRRGRRVRLLEPRGQAGGEEGRGGDGAERGRQAYRNEQIGALDPLQARNEQWCIKIDERTARRGGAQSTVF